MGWGEDAEDGRYEIRLHNAAEGEWMQLVIADRVPSQPAEPGAIAARPTALFASPHNNELYVILLEKAFAKLASCGSAHTPSATGGAAASSHYSQLTSPSPTGGRSRTLTTSSSLRRRSSASCSRIATRTS